MEIKLNDVYSFQFNEEYIKTHFEPYHCFDGQLIVKNYNGELRLKDTYYSTSKYFTLEELQSVGTLTFKCNLNDVETCRESDKMYYAKEDIINLSYQRGCYKWFVKKKGAKRVKEVMLKEIGERMETINRKIKYSLDDYAKLYHLRELIEQGGDLDKIHIPSI
jgi:superfamily II helicase